MSPANRFESGLLKNNCLTRLLFEKCNLCNFKGTCSSPSFTYQVSSRWHRFSHLGHICEPIFLGDQSKLDAYINNYRKTFLSFQCVFWFNVFSSYQSRYENRDFLSFHSAPNARRKVCQLDEWNPECLHENYTRGFEVHSKCFLRLFSQFRSLGHKGIEKITDYVTHLSSWLSYLKILSGIWYQMRRA